MIAKGKIRGEGVKLAAYLLKGVTRGNGRNFSICGVSAFRRRI